MIKIVILVLLAFFKEPGDEQPSFHYALVPMPTESIQYCNEHKEEMAKQYIPDDAVLAGATCHEDPVYPKDAI